MKNIVGKIEKGRSPCIDRKCIDCGARAIDRDIKVKEEISEVEKTVTVEENVLVRKRRK